MKDGSGRAAGCTRPGSLTPLYRPGTTKVAMLNGHRVSLLRLDNLMVRLDLIESA